MGGTVTSPLSGIIQGMLTGWSLGQQIRQGARQQEAYERLKAREDEEAGVRDLENRMKFASLTRPVDDLGLVTDKMQIGESAPGLGPITIDAPRKAKGAITYKSRNGETLRGEPLQPEELIRRQVDQATAMKRIGSTPVATPQHLQDLGLPATLWVPDSQLTHFAETGASTAPVETPAAARQLGYPERVPAKSVTAVMSGVGREMDRVSREKTAGENRTAADKRAADNRAAQDKRSAAANATRLQIHNTPGAPKAVTPNAEGVQNRFQKRLQENDQKEVRQLQQDEQALHAEKVQVGESLKSPDLPDLKRKELEAKLPALDLRIRAKQARQRQLIQKWNGGQAAPAATAPRPRAADAKGNVVEFDGTAWVPVAK